MRNKHLFDEFASFENLHEAWKKARKNKTSKPAVKFSAFAVEDILWDLHERLVTDTYEPDEYVSFSIHDPKPRIITRSTFRDRIIHHTLLNCIEPIFDKKFIDQSFACRKGKGTHKALEYAKKYVRRYDYYLKCDIQKYFPSINHSILKEQLCSPLQDPKLQKILAKLIDKPSDCQKWNVETLELRQNKEIAGYGIPIGNLTSQFFANVYLNSLDHFIKRELKCKGYLRYVDDFVFFSDSKTELWDWLWATKNFLYEHLRLLIHPKKQNLFPCSVGLDFVGYRIYPAFIRVRASSIKRFTKKYRKKIWHFLNSYIYLTPEEKEAIRTSICGWYGHIQHASSQGLVKHVLGTITQEVNQRFQEEKYRNTL